MSRKVILPLLGVLIVAGLLVWWQQGGAGGPVTDQAARKYFSRIVAAAQQRDFDALCDLNSSKETCEFDLRIACRPPVGGPVDPGRATLMEWCRAAMPAGAPEIVSSADRPSRSGSSGGRLLRVAGTDGYGRRYETEVLIFRDKRSYRATHAVFWSGEKFPT